MIQIPDTPVMPEACAELLEKQLSSCSAFVEYGSGGSTLLALSHQVPRIVSVESDQAWLQAIETRRDAMLPTYGGTHVTRWIDIGATGDWGYPLGSEKHAAYWKYPMVPWIEELPRPGKHLILIDGRFRVACLLLSCALAPPDSTILFDDYVDRPWYHGVERLIRPARRVDRMAVFELDQSLPMDARFLNLLLPSLQDAR